MCLVPHNVRTERLKNRKRVLETVLLTLGDMSTYCGIAPAGAEGLDGKLPIPELVSHVIGSRGFVPRPMSGLPSLVLVPDNAERGNYAFIADLARRHGWSLLSENDLSECLASPVLGAVGEGGTDSAFYRDVLRPAITSALAAAARRIYDLDLTVVVLTTDGPTLVKSLCKAAIPCTYSRNVSV